MEKAVLVLVLPIVGHAKNLKTALQALQGLGVKLEKRLYLLVVKKTVVLLDVILGLHPYFFLVWTKKEIIIYNIKKQ